MTCIYVAQKRTVMQEVALNGMYKISKIYNLQTIENGEKT